MAKKLFKPAMATRDNPPAGFDCWDDEVSLEENILLNRRLATMTDADFVDGDEVLSRLVPELYA